MGRITALDPDYLFWEFKEPKQRLSSEDATFVYVIHTDGGGLGFMRCLGHVDVFPNGGLAPQPGCRILSGAYKNANFICRF